MFLLYRNIFGFIFQYVNFVYSAKCQKGKSIKIDNLSFVDKSVYKENLYAYHSQNVLKETEKNRTKHSQRCQTGLSLHEVVTSSCNDQPSGHWNQKSEEKRCMDDPNTHDASISGRDSNTFCASNAVNPICLNTSSIVMMEKENESSLVPRKSILITVPRKKLLFRPNIKSVSHLVSVLFGLHGCNSIMKFIRSLTIRPVTPVLDQLSDLLLFCDYYDHFAMQNKTSFLVSAYFTEWISRLEMLACSLSIENLYPGMPLDHKIFCNGLIINITLECLQNITWVRANPFITLGTIGQHCDNCKSLNILHAPKCDFSMAVFPFYCTTADSICQIFYDSINRKICIPPEKCCPNPRLHGYCYYIQAGAPIIYITTFWSEKLASVIKPQNNHKIALEFTVTTEKNNFFYRLVTGIFEENGDASLLVRRGQNWYLIRDKLFEKADPDAFLALNRNWTLFYQLASEE